MISLITPLILLTLSIVILYVSGEIIIKSSVFIANVLRIPTLIIGLTVVSFATSLPEIFVSIEALLEGSSNIALGNVFGSNIANLSLVMAILAILNNLNISKQTFKIDYPFLLTISLSLGIVMLFSLSINFWIGTLFLIILIFYLIYLISTGHNIESLDINKSKDVESFKNNFHIIKNITLLLFGVFALKSGADMLVKNTIDIASYFGISDRVIAVTIVAFGTSVPELVTSIVASYKKQQGLAIGNLIGSNIFNILAVIGVSSVIKEIKITDKEIIYYDYLYMLFVTFLLGLFIYISRNKIISKHHGYFLLSAYIIYIVFNIASK
ncbi:MAG: sodium:calcium antiporter [Flavobacteriales bacterium]|nr:MAG: sodium:calcium antiporter [Flavobacteriales bacterium]